MQCRTCGYLLAGLTTLRCPECGSEFDPSDRRSVIEIGPGAPLAPQEWLAMLLIGACMIAVPVGTILSVVLSAHTDTELWQRVLFPVPSLIDSVAATSNFPTTLLQFLQWPLYALVVAYGASIDRFRATLVAVVLIHVGAEVLALSALYS